MQQVQPRTAYPLKPPATQSARAEALEIGKWLVFTMSAKSISNVGVVRTESATAKLKRQRAEDDRPHHGPRPRVISEPDEILAQARELLDYTASSFEEFTAGADAHCCAMFGESKWHLTSKVAIEGWETLWRDFKYGRTVPSERPLYFEQWGIDRGVKFTPRFFNRFETSGLVTNSAEFFPMRDLFILCEILQ